MPMPRLKDPERLRFTVSTARTVRLPVPADGPPLLPWPVASLGGGLLAALCGSVLVAGVVLVAWLSAIAIPLPAVLAFSAQVWLLAHGGAISIGNDPVTLVPLGLTLALGGICASTAGFAYRQGRQARTGEISPRTRRLLLIGTVVQVALGYTAFAAGLAWAVVGVNQLWRPTLGAFGVSLLSAGVGAGLAAGWRPLAAGPAWLRRGLRGAAVGTLALLIAASVALATALVLGETRVASLEAGLRLDSGGVVVWSLVALAYLPNLLGWTLAWVLGAGFTVGTGSLVSLWTTQLGMLPAIPVFGALPPAGLGDPWLQAWLAVGAVAGGLTGVAAVRHGRTGPLGALIASAVSGLLAGALYVGWLAASRGGLGGLRLVDLGPRLLEALLIGAPTLFLSAVLAGLATWFVRRRSAAS